jgi:hypothetical protein
MLSDPTTPYEYDAQDHTTAATDAADGQRHLDDGWEFVKREAIPGGSRVTWRRRVAGTRPPE